MRHASGGQTPAQCRADPSSATCLTWVSTASVWVLVRGGPPGHSRHQRLKIIICCEIVQPVEELHSTLTSPNCTWMGPVAVRSVGTGEMAQSEDKSGILGESHRSCSSTTIATNLASHTPAHDGGERVPSTAADESR